MKVAKIWTVRPWLTVAIFFFMIAAVVWIGSPYIRGMVAAAVDGARGIRGDDEARMAWERANPNDPDPVFIARVKSFDYGTLWDHGIDFFASYDSITLELILPESQVGETITLFLEPDTFPKHSPFKGVGTIVSFQLHRDRLLEDYLDRSQPREMCLFWGSICDPKVVK